MTSDAHGGATVAYVDPGVVARLLKCDDSACRIEVQGYDGWLPRGDVWGTYPDEKLQGD
jgi:SH3-like domain-containing protein